MDRKILDLLLFSKELYAETGGRVNIAMGSVLSLWARRPGGGASRTPRPPPCPTTPPSREAAAHTDIGAIQIDEEAGTVYFTDPELRLDVGAIAKGYAAQRVCENAPEGLLISIGGNVCATGPKPDSGQPWVVGIEDPDDTSRYLHTLYVDNYAVVTSGDYQRYYTVDGVGLPPHHRPRHPLPRPLLAGRHHLLPRLRPGRRPLHRPVHPAASGGSGAAGPL